MRGNGRDCMVAGVSKINLSSVGNQFSEAFYSYIYSYTRCSHLQTGVC